MKKRKMEIGCDILYITVKLERNLTEGTDNPYTLHNPTDEELDLLIEFINRHKEWLKEHEEVAKLEDNSP